MPLKKPSDFFKKEETSLDSIKGEMDVSSPDKIERVSEAFTAFRSNLNHIQSLTDFSDTFDVSSKFGLCFIPSRLISV